MERIRFPSIIKGFFTFGGDIESKTMNYKVKNGLTRAVGSDENEIYLCKIADEILPVESCAHWLLIIYDKDSENSPWSYYHIAFLDEDQDGNVCTKQVPKFQHKKINKQLFRFPGQKGSPVLVATTKMDL